MRPEQDLAPPRGRYDRQSTPQQRVRAQRERLLRAAAAAFVQGQPNVSRAAALARAGRSSFYEFFDDFEHALEVVRTSTLSTVERALNDALDSEHTPTAALHALAAALANVVRSSAEAALVTLASAGTETSPLGDCFRRVLGRWLSAPGASATLTLGSDSTRLLLATGAAEAFARRIALAELSDDAAHAGYRPERPASGAGHELAAALLRLFR
jgi:hypothetical protein